MIELKGIPRCEDCTFIRKDGTPQFVMLRYDINKMLYTCPSCHTVYKEERLNPSNSRGLE